MKKILTLIILVSLTLSATSQRSLNKKLERLDVYFEQALEDWEVPGMAVAIVKDGEIIFSKGYGTRNVETGEPVDPNTLFAIASNSKSFTTAALAMLVDEGKINWNDKVREYLPWFKLYDPYVSENMTIKDLLTHRSGLKTFSGDLIWWGTGYSSEEVVRRARHCEPTYGFRAHYGYNNIMYIAAGLIIEEVTGKDWNVFIRERILDPLEMSRTVTSVNDLPGMENVSAPHNDVDGSQITIEWQNWDNVAAAGGLISCVNDVSKWLIFQMNKGVTFDGDTLIEAERFREMWSVVTPQGISAWSESMYPSTHFRGYGLGWSVHDYLGKKVIGHGGGYDGFITNTTFIPEENLGFTILTNKNTSLYYPLRFKIMDEMLENEEEKDWSADFLELIKMREANQKKAHEKAEEERAKDSKPTLPVESYLGTYTSEMYGDAVVYMEDDRMMVDFKPTGKAIGHLDHWQYNTWQVELKQITSLPKGLVNFLINDQGEVYEMQVDIPNPDFDFTELEFLKKR